MSPMMTVHAKPGEGNMTRLAEKLVRRLGVEDALRVCRDNSWHGVLRIIQGRQNDRVHD